MSRRTKSREPPAYAFYDNPCSRFGMIYADLLKSEQFQALSCPAKSLYVTCVAHSATDAAKKCLHERLREINTQTAKSWTEQDIANMTYDQKQGLFVFPAKHYSQYGYTKGYFSKYMGELREAGFIKTVYGGRNQYSVTVLAFDTKWKLKAVTT